MAWGTALGLTHRLRHTTALRLSLRYAIYIALLTGLGFGALYWAIGRYVDAQTAASLEQQIASLLALARDQGPGGLIEAMTRRPLVEDENRRYLLLATSDGRRIAGDLKAWPHGLPTDGQVRNIWIEDDLIPGQGEDQDGFWPIAAALLPDGRRLLVAQGIRQAEDLQEYILTAIVLTLGLSIGLTLLLGWRLGTRILDRIDRINDTARAIGKGDLQRRVPVSGANDEFDALAEHLNNMLLRIERLVAGMREVTDNVAHDLRRPLSRLRNRLDVTLLEARSEADYRRTLEEARADIEGLIHTFNALLEITQTEAGSYRGEWGPLDLAALARDLGELYEGMVEERGQAIRLEIGETPPVIGNRHLLGQAIGNLLENAIKFTPAGGRILLATKESKGRAILEVSDTGPGIPPAERERVMLRFVRLDSARDTPGNGLGLSLVRAVSTLHRADLELHDNRPGLRVVLRFPLGGRLEPRLAGRRI